MDTQTTAAESQHPYPLASWNSNLNTPTGTTTPSATVATPSPSISSAPASNSDGSPFHSFSHSPIPDPATATATSPFHAIPPDLLPYLWPQQSNNYHAQLLHYNKLISPARGGGLQTPPLPPVVSAPHIQAAPRSRSSSKVSLKDASATKGNTGGGHGSRSNPTSDKNRSVVTSKEVPSKMSSNKTPEAARALPRRPAPPSHPSQSHSNSVPSTPHQHARQFSFEDRDPSPTATNNHSPRSAYSETSTLPSLRPLPPRLGGCKYETSQINSRRRIPYSVGSERLEKLDLKTVKSKLSEEEERKLATDMREIYDRLLPTEAVEQNRTKLVLKLERIFNDEWPGHDIKVQLFGSSGNLLCSDDSDVDICITTPWRAMEDVCMIADLLAKRGMEKVVCISAAKVPIVKIWDPELGLACDMNVNNTVALENTRMVRTYVEMDPRVRQLAMIIKHWTRRRIVNDAAFGGTLSSYTWICLIIAFLQLRNPPILTSLHQSPHKLSKSDGSKSVFADDLKKLSGFGGKNKSSVAELLFQFFRFYAHEFDYDKHVLSVRLGKLLTKQEKNWNYGMNNQLCVEEPFNTGRNLGNTADEYSFRGLHMELRRAFDLLSVAKFEETCEQYVFPKEEERVWSRPPPQSRPVLLRSSSQTHSGRGGRGNHRGGRHNNGFHRNNNNNNNNNSSRRASSSVPTPYDANNMFMQSVVTPEMQWFPGTQFPFQYTQQDLINHMAYQMFAQSSGFMQHQHQHQAMGQGQQQRMSSTPASGQQSADRSRTNSFDNPPLSAPLRPDLYAAYGMTMAQPYFPQSNSGYTYPSSPASATTPTQDFRRSLQRSAAGVESGSAANGSQRSHSQPASRSPSSAYPVAGYFVNPGMSSVPNLGSGNVNGVSIPKFISDDGDFDETPKAQSESPRSEEGKYPGYYQTEQSSPGRLSQHSQQSQQSHPSQKQTNGNGVAFGEVSNQATKSSSPGRRQLTADQMPQTILDRRMRRTSRSPSPLGHSRAFSVGTSSAPLTSAPFPGSQNHNLTRPLVVNGSGLKPSAANRPRKPSGTESSTSEEELPASFDNPLQIKTDSPKAKPTIENPVLSQLTQEPPAIHPLPDRPPVVANGSSAPVSAVHSDDPSFRERIDMITRYYLYTPHILQEMLPNGHSRLSPSTRQRLMSRQPQNGVIAPLDLAIAENRISNPIGPELSHLSPVYETRTPSPTVVRKFDGSLKQEKTGLQPDAKSFRVDAPKASVKPDERSQGIQESPKSQKGSRPAPQTQRVNGARESGHVRGAKSESDGGWQKAGKGKKKGTAGAGFQGNGEQLPKRDSERKGG